MSNKQGPLFKEWLVDTGKMPSTANAYLSGVNTVTSHLKRDVLLITDLNELQTLYRQYGPGGEHAQIGASNSGNVQGGLKQWLEYQRQLQQAPGSDGDSMAIEGYADQQVDKLFKKATPEMQAWAWTLLMCFRQHYPQADHWTVNINPADIRIGVRERGALKGKTLYALYWYGGEIRCSLRDIADYRTRMEDEGLDWEIAPDNYPKAADMQRWFESVDRVLQGKQLPVQGSGLMPLDYGQLGQEELDVTEMTTDSAIKPALNQILFGPPGTGKTYATIEAALEVLDSSFLQENCRDRAVLKQRFDQLADEGRIRFVTFHQSFSYEDFVEGLRAENDEATGQLRYEVVDGVFKSLCEVASAKVTVQAAAPLELGGRRVWKMSLGNTLGSDASIYEECVQGGYMLLGYGGGIDFSSCKNRSDVKQCFADGGVTLDGSNDYSLTSVSAYVTKMKVGDLVVVSDGNFKFRAIGEITGDYAFKPHADYEDGYAQMRPVKWLRQYSPSLPHSELLNAQFSQMTLYELRSPTLNREKLKALLGTPEVDGGSLLHVGQRFGQGYVVRSIGPDVVEFDKPRGGVLPLPLSLLRQLLAYARSGQIDVDDIRQGRVFEKVAEAELEKYIVNGYQSLFAAMVEQLLKPQDTSAATDARVLIIDEINRGNVSRIFGELITLIERSKRAGADEALSVVLPYSKQRFSVPSNVYLIGTMNTADRSLAGLDIALRRRFTFKEMLPDHQLLKGVLVEGIDIGELLAVMNQRIEVLLDRDHCLGHAYFMSLKSGDPLARLESIFRNQILPLLQEYFFEDWQRIQWVLNDHRKPAADRFVEQSKPDLNNLFGSMVTGVQGGIWRVMPGAFTRASAYAGIIAAELELQAVAIEVAVVEEVG